MKTIFLLICFLFISFITRAQTYEHYIATTDVFSLALDDDMLWLGTDGGIVKFNTVTEEFTNYTKIYDASIQGHYGHTFLSLAVGHDGTLYSSGEGFISFDGVDWHSYTSENSNLPWFETRFVAIDNNNNIWAASREYMCKLNNNQWQNYKLMDASFLAYFGVNECDFDSENNVWVGTSRGLFKIENEKVEGIDHFHFGEINSLKAGNDTVLVGTRKKGLVFYTPSDSSIVEFNTENSNITSNWVQHVYPTKDSHWVIADNLLLFKDGAFTVYMDEDSVLDNLILNRVLPDGDNIWLGTANDGLFKYNLTTNTCEKKTITNTPLQSSENPFCVDTMGCMYFNESNTLKINDNNTWSIKTKEDLNYFNQNYTLKYTSDTLLYDEKNNVLFCDYKEHILIVYNNNLRMSGPVKMDKKNNIYELSSSGGYYVYDGKWTKYTKDNSVIPTQYVSNLCLDNYGKLWFVADPGLDTITHEIIPGGLVSYDGNEHEIISTKNIPGVDDTTAIISYLYIDNSNILWLGISELFTRGETHGYGLFRYDGNSWTNYTIDNSELASNTITCINSYDNKLYIGTTGGGISVLDTSSGTWETYNTENSVLPWNSIYSINFDMHGNMYTHVQFNGVLKTNKDLDFIQTNVEYEGFSEESFIVFPNPTRDRITIKNSSGAPYSINQVNVYDLTSKLLISKNIQANSKEISLSLKEALNNEGMYFINIITNKKSFTRAIIFYR